MTVAERLPSYERPPVIEVLASVQFDPLPNFNIVHFGLLWQRFRDRFPVVEMKPPIPPAVERLGVRAPLNQVQVQISDGVELPRLWFVNKAGDELLQVQSDRFIRNWRAVPSLEKAYPRYERYIRPRFVHDYRAFQELLTAEAGAEIEPNQCEITYINHITPNEHWSSHKDLAVVFRGWNEAYSSAIAQSVEAINLRTVHLLHDEAGEFVGRLHVVLQSVYKSPSEQPAEANQPIFLLTLTARGKPMGPGEKGVLNFLDTGRRAIVTAFDSMTTTEMHMVWGKRYDS